MTLKNIKKSAAAAVLLALVLMLTACGDPGQSNNAAGNNSNTPGGNSAVPADPSNTVPTPGGNTNDVTDPDADLTPVERAYKHISEMCSALKDKAIEFIKSKADEIEWSLGDVRRGSKSADVDIGFDYKGNVTGMIEIKLIKENGKWKISGIGMPSFTKMKLF